MRKLVTLATLLLAAYSFSITAAQKHGSIKRVEVTPKSVAGRGAKPYVIDLTRGGTAYELAKGLDYSRVRVRTSKGEQTISEVLGNRTIEGKLLLGLTTDLRQLKLNLGASSTRQFNCDIPALCSCSGDADCNDLFSSGKCGDVAGCTIGQPGDAPKCWCLKKL
jgi:hypothetical protein